MNFSKKKVCFHVCIQVEILFKHLSAELPFFEFLHKMGLIHNSKQYILKKKISSQYIGHNYCRSINKSYLLPCTQFKKEQEGTYASFLLLCVPLFKLILRRPNCISHVLLFSHVNIYHALIFKQ